MILVNSVVEEEVVELIDLLEKEGNNILLYLPIKLHNINTKYCEIIFYKDIFRNNFLNKIADLIRFQYIVLKNKPDCIYTGFSMIKHRLSSKIFRIKHIAYIRGLLFDSNNHSGIGDKLRYGKLSFFFQNSIFNTYYADKIITISNINKNFMINRGINKDSIFLINPPWLVNIRKKKRKKEYNKIVFLTQAFEFHGFSTEHKSQISFLEKHLIPFCKKQNFELIIRVHPRDCFFYEKYNFEVNKEKSIDFLKKLDSDFLIISPLSTFAFEAIFLNIKVVFYSTNILNKIYLDTYNTLNIKPIYRLSEIDIKRYTNVF
jgi:hypothetical protein